jgi:hypothetical protein
VASPVNDSDGDGIEDDVDNCPADANADQADRDRDGIGEFVTAKGHNQELDNSREPPF